jgi:hypothetical protein
MKYNQLLMILKLLILMSFFLPFFYGCDREESIRYSRQKAREKIVNDSLSRSPDSVESNDTAVAKPPADSDSTLIRKFWKQITLPDYGRGFALTGFAYFTIAVQQITDFSSGFTPLMLSALFILMFLSVCSMPLISVNRRKIQIRLSAFIFISLIIFLGIEELDDHLYGYWLAMALSFTLLLVLIKDKALKRLMEE